MRCKICGNKNNNKLFEVKEMQFGFEEYFTYIECQECGCLQLSEIPQDMSKYYPSDYYSFQELKLSNFHKIKRMLGIQRDKYVYTGHGIIGFALNKIYPTNSLDMIIRADVNFYTKILDVGCGSGHLLYSLKDIGFKNLIGIDPYIEEDIDKNCVKIFKKYMHELDEKFDLIMFNHSFEHIPNPDETLKSVSRFLSENGKCVIRIPTVSSYAWKNYNVNWVQLDAPRHFFLYSIESIKLLALKYKLNLKDYYYDSTDFQFWGSEQYLEGIPTNSEKSYSKNHGKSIFSKNKIKSFKKMAEKLNDNNTGDQVTLFFTKN